MATVSVRIDDFEDGALPRRCAATGAPADGLYTFRATRSSRWPLVLVLTGPFGWLIALVVLIVLAGRVDGLLPMTDAAVEGARAARRRALLHLVEAMAALVGLLALTTWRGWVGASLVVLAAGSLAIGWALASVFRPAGSLGLRWSHDGRHVVVRDAHPTFVDAYVDQERRRVEARRRAAAQPEPRGAPGRRAGGGADPAT